MVLSVARLKRILVLLVLAMTPLFVSGCLLNQILDDIVNEDPHAVIEATPRQGSAPLNVDFNAQYSRDDGSIVSYRWNFGDPMNTQSALTSATTHTFTQPGTYIVKLTVTDDEGAVNSQEVAIVVTDAPPIAKASVNNENPLPGASVIFAATGSHDVQGDIVSYDWDFGDGKTGTGETAEHAYIQGGYYVVTLTVTDEAGNTAQANLSINVLPGESQCTDNSTCNGGDPLPLAIITSKYFSCTSNGQVGDSIDLDGSASRGGVGNVVSYHWDFGDGTTGSGPTVSHVYAKAWTYIITLTVVDEGGGMNSATGTIYIGGASCSG